MSSLISLLSSDHMLHRNHSVIVFIKHVCQVTMADKCRLVCRLYVVYSHQIAL